MLIAVVTATTLWASCTGRLRPIDRTAETALTATVGPRQGHTIIVEIDAASVAATHGDVWAAILGTLDGLKRTGGGPRSVVLVPGIPVAPTPTDLQRLDALRAELRVVWLPWRLMADANNALVPPFPTAKVPRDRTLLPLMAPRPDADGVVWAEPMRIPAQPTPTSTSTSPPTAETPTITPTPAGTGNGAGELFSHVALHLVGREASRVPDIVRLNYTIRPAERRSAMEWLRADPSPRGVAGRHVILTVTDPRFVPERHQWPTGVRTGTVGDVQAQVIETVVASAWLRDVSAWGHVAWLMAVAAVVAFLLPRLGWAGMVALIGVVGGVWWAVAAVVFDWAFALLSPAPTVVLLVALIVNEAVRRTAARRRQMALLERFSLLVGHSVLRRALPAPVPSRRFSASEFDAHADAAADADANDELAARSSNAGGGRDTTVRGAVPTNHAPSPSASASASAPSSGSKLAAWPVPFVRASSSSSGIAGGTVAGLAAVVERLGGVGVAPPTVIYGQLAALIRLMFSPKTRIDIYAAAADSGPMGETASSIPTTPTTVDVVWRDASAAAKDLPAPPETVVLPVDACKKLAAGFPVRMNDGMADASGAATTGTALLIPAREPVRPGDPHHEHPGELLGVVAITARQTVDIGLPEELGVLNLLRAVGDAAARALLDARASVALREWAGRPAEPSSTDNPLAGPWRWPLPETTETQLDRLVALLAAGGADAERAWLALDCLPVGIALLDLDTRIVYANRAFDLRPALPSAVIGLPTALEPTLAELLAAKTGRTAQEEEAEFIALAGLRRRVTFPVTIDGQPRRLTVMPLISPTANRADAPLAGLLALLQDRTADDRWARVRRKVADFLTSHGDAMPADLAERLSDWFDLRPVVSPLTPESSALPATADSLEPLAAAVFDLASVARDAAAAVRRDVAGEWPAEWADVSAPAHPPISRVLGDASAAMDLFVEFWRAIPPTAGVTVRESAPAGAFVTVTVDLTLAAADVAPLKSAFGTIAARLKPLGGQLTAEAGALATAVSAPASTAADSPHDFRIVAHLSMPRSPR